MPNRLGAGRRELFDRLQRDLAKRTAAKIIEQRARGPGDIGHSGLLHENAAAGDEINQPVAVAVGGQHTTGGTH